MKKLRVLILVFIVYAITLTACNKGKGTTIPLSSSNITSSRLKENVVIATELESLEIKIPSNTKKYVCTKTALDYEIIKDALLTGKGDIQTEKLSTVYTYKTDSNDFLTIGVGNISFLTDLYATKLSPIAYFNENSILYKGANFIDNDDLPFMSQDEAIEEALNFFKHIGVENMTVQQIYVLDQDKLNTTYQELIREGRAATFDKTTGKEILFDIKYTDSDNYYYLSLRETVDNVNIIPYSHGSTDDDSFVTGTSADIIFSTTGVEYVSVKSHYSITDSEECSQIIKLEQAINFIKQKYDELILESPVIIEDVSFVYVPMIENKKENQYCLVPAWLFNTTRELLSYGTNVKEKKSEFILIDANTGKEIY